MTLVFDLDGTLLDHTPGGAIDYESARVLEARSVVHADACWLVAEYLNCGTRVAFATARPAKARGATRRTLRAARLERVPLFMRERPWGGWEQYEADKTALLRKLRARVYVGDLDGRDGRAAHDARAAKAAGAVFMSAATWRALSQSLRASESAPLHTQVRRPIPAGVEAFAASLPGGA